jgi:hypothetical protein
MLLFAFLPWLAFWLIWRLLTLNGFGWRSAFLAAQAISGVLIVASTEALSAFRLLNFPCLLIFWTLICSLAVFFLRKHPDAFRLSVPAFTLSLVEKILFGCGILIVAVVGMIALIAPPNTADSMAYHMSRVMHWLQNASVRNYPTADFRQLVYFPYAEYAILHLQVLSVSDRFANLVQWTAMIGSVVGVSLIAKLLGLERRGQILTALFVLTIPMGILQGSSTQTDYIVTLWLVSSVFFALKLGFSWQYRWAVLSAMSFGLALLTKGTGLFFGLPFILLWLCFFNQSVKRKAVLLGIGVAIALLINGSFFVRLQEVDRNPLKAFTLPGSVSVAKPGLIGTVSSIVRNTAMELALPWEDWNRTIEKVVFQVHRGLGIDSSDRRITFGQDFSVGFSLDDSLDEDCANNFLHTILIFLIGVLFWFYRPKSKQLWFYAAAVFLAGISFCMFFMWQRYICRFHLSLYVLFAPVVVVVLTRFWSARTLVIMALVLVLGGVPYLFWNNSRRIFSEKSMFLSSRKQIYFAKNRAEYEVYRKIADALVDMGCRDIGLHTGAAYWQYSWWPLLGWPRNPVRIEHVAVSNKTVRFPYPLGDFSPCAIIAETTDNMPPVIIEGDRPYVRAAGSWILTVYLDATRLKH